MAHVRCLEGPTEGRSLGEWHDLIAAANQIEPGTFGRPDSLERWWAGGSVEEYPHASVIFRDDHSVSVVSKTAHGDQIIRAAAAQLNMEVQP